MEPSPAVVSPPVTTVPVVPAEVGPAPVYGRAEPLAVQVPAGGMRLSPAMVLVRDLPLGAPIDFGASGLPIVVENRTETAMTLSIRAVTVAPPYERGYEPLPDPAWLRLEPGQLELPARTRMLVQPVLTLPDQAGLANRRFIVGVQLGAGGSGGSVGAGLALVARMQLETQSSDDLASNLGQPLSLAPGVAIADLAGDTTTRVVRLRNNGTAAMAWQARPFTQTITRPDRQSRYRAAEFVAADGWSRPEPASGELPPGGEVAITFTTNLPAGAKPGRYEELWFVGPAADLDLAGSTEVDHQPICAFVRLHHRVGDMR